jgi:hypothetical protein
LASAFRVLTLLLTLERPVDSDETPVDSDATPVDSDATPLAFALMPVEAEVDSDDTLL